MADTPVTCRYCGDTNVKTYNSPGGGMPLCDAHARRLRERMLGDIDRVMGQPVANPAVDEPEPAVAPEQC